MVNNDLERMGDLVANICERAEMLITTNLAEDVIFMADGDIVRHNL